MTPTPTHPPETNLSFTGTSARFGVSLTSATATATAAVATATAVAAAMAVTRAVAATAALSRRMCVFARARERRTTAWVDEGAVVWPVREAAGVVCSWANGILGLEAQNDFRGAAAADHRTPRRRELACVV